MDDYKELIRTLVRPVITLSGWTVYLVMLEAGKAVPDEAFKAIIGFTAWFFVDRSIAHFRNGK